MKSYTDINQSKKLAEILPIESADLSYLSKDGRGIEFFEEPVVNDGTWEDDDIPCWSLAALLDIIPQEIFDGEYVINITEGIDNRWVLTYDHYENRNHSYYGLSTGADNLVDACYEIVLKLKEKNLKNYMDSKQNLKIAFKTEIDVKE